MSGRRVLVLCAATCVTSLALVPPGPVSATQPGAAAVPASVCFPNTDNGDPALLSLSLTPDAVDVRDGAASITVTATVADSGGPGAPSGVKNVLVYASDGRPAPAGGTDSPRVLLLPTAGGTRSGTLRIVKSDFNGTRRLHVAVTDRAGNYADYTGAALRRLGMPASFSTRSHPDLAAPKLTSLTVSASIVDTRRTAKTVTVKAHATDENSGVRTVRATLPGGIGANLTRVHGGPRRGTWAGKLTIPKWHERAGSGLTLRLRDVVGHRAAYTTRRLRELGYPSAVRKISPIDKRAPSVKVTSTTPSTLDVRQTDGAIIFVARAADATSGVRSVRVLMIGDPELLTARTRKVELTRVAGTTRHGRWRGILPLKRCATPAGKWTASLRAVDRAGNASFAKPKPVVAIDSSDVQRPAAHLPGDTAGIPLSGPVTVRFNEDVTGLTAATAVVQSGVYLRQRDLWTPTPVAGTWSCTTQVGAAVDCAAGPLRQAHFTPEHPFVDFGHYSVVLNPEHQLALTDLSGNPSRPGGLVAGFFARAG